MCKLEESTMESYWKRKQEKDTATIDLLKSINDLMSSESSNGGPFERVNLKGKNVGATMIARHSPSGESFDCCSINIYVNNNIQGVSNSVLVGSEVKLGDPGVCLTLTDVKLGKAFLDPNRRTMITSNLGVFGMFLFVLIAIFMFLWLF